MSAITFKVSLKNNIHRFSLPSEDLSISKLDEVLLKVFERKFVVKFIKKYQDPEGDLITLRTDFDLQEAVKIASSLNAANPIIKIFLEVPERRRPTEDSGENPHRGHHHHRHHHHHQSPPHSDSDEAENVSQKPEEGADTQDLASLLKKLILNPDSTPVEQLTTDIQSFLDGLFGKYNRNFRRRHGECRSRFHRRGGFGRQDETTTTATYKSRFIADVTLPDASEVKADSSIVKTWKLCNDGEFAWPAGCALTYVGGDKLTAEDSVILTEDVNPGESVDISLSIRTPKKQGRYISHYRMTSPDGILFGQRIYNDIIVCDPEEDSDDESEEEVAIVTDDIEQTIEKPKEVNTEETETEYAKQLSHLAGMGFSNSELCIHLLRESGGDINAVIEKLLS